jgi:hypothetical protein
MATKPVDTPINPAYISGQVINCAAYIGSRPPILSLLEDSKKGFGQRSIDAAYLRCQFLLQTDPGMPSVLSMDRWPDCEMEAIDPLLVRARALKEAGSNQTDTGFVQDILVALDDQTDGEGPPNQSGLSAFLVNVLNPKDWPLQGTTGREAVETIIQLTAETANVIVGIVKRAFPTVGDYTQDALTIIYIFIDLMRFVGDYLGEYYNVWHQQNNRSYSMQRKANIDGKYAAMYGAKPSSATLRAWCNYGANIAKPKDGSLAPDGTTEAYDIDRAVWETTQAAAQTQVPAIASRFGNDFARFYAANIILAGWYGGYDNIRGLYEDRTETTYTEGIHHATLYDTVAAGVVENYWSGKVWFPILNILQRPTNPDQWASTIRIPAEHFYQQDFYAIPFWERTFFGLYGNPNSTGFTADQRVEFKRMAKFAAWNYYRNTSINDFSRDMLAVWEMWDAASMGADLTSGKKRRDRWIKTQLTNNIQHFQDQLDFLASLQPGYQQNYTTWKVAVSDVLSASDPAPNPAAPEYKGIKGSCPDPTNPNSTACLPCDAIKVRRPVGAKPLDVPLELTWSGNGGKFRSPEFAAWKRALNDAGYPDYYVDCLARDVKFTAAPGASDEPLKPCPFGYTRTPSGQCISILRPGINYRELQDTIAQIKPLSGLDTRTQAIATRALRGITRPMVAELAGPVLPRRR